MFCARKSSKKAIKTLLSLTLTMATVAVATIQPAHATVSITAFGATPNDATNDTNAIISALNSGDTDVYVPDGNYYIGSGTIDIPAGVTLRGQSSASKLICVAGTGKAIQLHYASQMQYISVDCTNVTAASQNQCVVFLGNDADFAMIKFCRFNDAQRTAIMTDHANDINLKNCVFNNCDTAILTQFSWRVNVWDNTVNTAAVHGIQFWGNYNWTLRDSGDIQCLRNKVYNVGGKPGVNNGGGIWGCGLVRATFNANIVENCTDVCIDQEWSINGMMRGNTTRKSKNGGISLFYSCENMEISANTIYNDYPYTAPASGFWERAGIWLVRPNVAIYPGDVGHKNIRIFDNNITCTTGTKRRAAWLDGNANNNVRFYNNTVSGAPLYATTSTVTFTGNKELTGTTLTPI